MVSIAMLGPFRLKAYETRFAIDAELPPSACGWVVPCEGLP
nr:hypothetical protein [Burkholderia gladioli]